MVRYYGLYANAHRGKVRKESLAASPLRIIEEDCRRPPGLFGTWTWSPITWSNIFRDPFPAGGERSGRFLGSLAPEPAGWTCRADFFPQPTPLDTVRGPDYPRRRGQDGVLSRLRTRPRLRAEKEILSMMM